jgi:transketolase
MEMKSTREGYGEALLGLGKVNDKVVVLTADLKESTKVDQFAEVFPDRFVECGVAEQNMMGIAAGMAAAGKIPFVSSYAVFSPGRNWDQLRVSVCYSKLPVKIGGAHAGLSVGPDGATHQALEDIAITRVLPNLVVEVPCDYWEAKKATEAAVEINGPVYIRFFREKTPVMTLPEARYKIGKAELVWESGRDVAIVGCGPILYECLDAARRLTESGIGVVVINNHTIKPMDKQAIIDAAAECGAVVTVEEHQISGGMGSAVCEILAGNYPVPVEMVGVADTFGESGKPEELFEKYGLSAKYIEEAVKKVVKRKGNLEKTALI